MADNFPTFPFTTQEDWYGELSFISADDGSALSLEGRNFVMLITPATSGAELVEPKITLTMDVGSGLSLKNGDPSTLIFRVPKETANDLQRMEYTADVLEVVGNSRYLFMPSRIQYFEPSALRTFLTRFLGVKVSFASRRQPIITPVAVPGREGRAGATIINGTAPPAPADGRDGDFFIEDRGAGFGRRMYGPKAGGAWPGMPWNIQVAGIGDVPGLPEALDASVQREANGDDFADKAVVRQNIGLGEVDNTADEDKPVSLAQAAAIDERALRSEIIVAPTNGVVLRSLAERASDRPSVHDLAAIPPSAPDFASASAVAAKIREALANGLARNLRQIDVPGGVYDVASTEGTTGRGQLKAAVAIDGAGRESMVVNFRGTKLMLSADLAGSYSSHLVVRNVGRIVLTGDLTLDWTKLPYAQGVCTSINATTKTATFLLDLDTAGGAPAFADVQRISRHDPATGMWLGTIIEHNGIASAGRVLTAVPAGDAAYAGVGTYRVDFSATADQPALASLVVGASYALVSNPVGNHGLHFDGVDEVDMSGLRLRIHCANGFGISGIVHRRFVIGRAVRIGPAYRSKRFLATTADGIHIVGTRDLCSIHARVSHTGDDGLNINISSNFVQSSAVANKPANTFLVGVVTAGRVPEVGDTLQFENAAGVVSAGGKVLAVDMTGGFASTPAITMDTGFPAGFKGAADAGSSFETATRIHNLSDYATLDLDPIVSCTRNAGARVRGLGGRILGTWKDIPGPALYVACNLGLDNEGPNPSDLIIRPNIDNAGYFTTGVRAAIDITGAGRSGTGAVGMVQRIEVGGSVRNCNVGALYAQYIDGLAVSGLTTERCNLSPWVAGLGATAFDTVLIANSRNIALDGVASSSGAGTIRVLPECTGIRWGANPGIFYYGPSVDPIALPANLTLISGGANEGAGAALDIKTGANPTYAPMARIKGHFYNAPGSEQQGGLEIQTRAVGAAGQPMVTRADFDAFGALRWNVLEQIDTLPNGFMSVQKTGPGAARILWKDTDGVLRSFTPTWTPI